MTGFLVLPIMNLPYQRLFFNGGAVYFNSAAVNIDSAAVYFNGGAVKKLFPTLRKTSCEKVQDKSAEMTD